MSANDLSTWVDVTSRVKVCINRDSNVVYSTYSTQATWNTGGKASFTIAAPQAGTYYFLPVGSSFGQSQGYQFQVTPQFFTDQPYDAGFDAGRPDSGFKDGGRDGGPVVVDGGPEGGGPAVVDAAPRDTGLPVADAGVPDSGNPTVDSGAQPDSNTNPGGGGGGAGACACDQTYDCDPDCECDPECVAGADSASGGCACSTVGF
ncbi:MAG: hypothetical protein HY897_10850 [Deltaproteobacteria bacterium]|nr:hypothetical protein [Deltaproteobacteria bacterium]